MIFGGSYVDAASIATAATAPFVKPCRAWLHKRKRPDFDVPPRDISAILVDVLHGASLIPFLLLIGCVFSSDLLKDELQNNRVFFGLAGLIGALFVIGEIGRLRP